MKLPVSVGNFRYPNLADIKPNGIDIAQQTLEQLTAMLSTFIGNW